MKWTNIKSLPCRTKDSITISLALLGILTAIFLFLFYKATEDPQISFLPSHTKADWIQAVYAPTTYTIRGEALISTNFFKKQFLLNDSRGKLKLHIKAFKKYQLAVNGQIVATEEIRNWKEDHAVDISSYLKEGENKIVVRVESNSGPPALLIYSEGFREDIRTDQSWDVYLDLNTSMKAIPVTSMPHPISFESLSPLDASLIHLPFILSAFIFFSFLSGILLYKFKELESSKKEWILVNGPLFILVFFLILWMVLFVNNVDTIGSHGFDAATHEEYINYILTKSSFPTASDGYSMYHPPLFYLLSALIIKFFSLFIQPESAYLVLKFFVYLCGLGQIFLTYFVSRRIFPGNLLIQSLAILLSASIPMNLYISHYLSNEGLSAFFMNFAMVAAIGVFYEDGSLYRKNFLLVGLFLGLGLLTKFTTLLIVPVIYMLLLLDLLKRKSVEKRSFVKLLSASVLLLLIVSGWFYLRYYLHFGKFIVGNWESDAGFNWWQFPARYGSEYFMQFGKVFSTPYFAGFILFLIPFIQLSGGTASSVELL